MKSLVFLSLFAAAAAHLCLISPPQRGSMMGLNKIATTDCFLTAQPCGGRPTVAPILSIKAMENFTVTFQKNLNHWVQSSPGHFDVGVSDQITHTPLVRIMDMGEPSLHLYSVNITIPVEMKNKAVIIQALYVTNNPTDPQTFYQCSDVMVI